MMWIFMLERRKGSEVRDWVGEEIRVVGVGMMKESGVSRERRYVNGLHFLTLFFLKNLPRTVMSKSRHFASNAGTRHCGERCPYRIDL